MTDLCAVHPEVDAVGTCSRCGNFMCAECRVPDADTALCKSCDLRLGRHPLVRHVQWLAIGLIAHGVLTAGWGAFTAAFGGFYLIELASLPPPTAEEAGADFASGILVWVTAAIAIAHIVPGVLQMIAGWQMRKFRGRGLAILALSCGLMTLFGCYCALTSVTLLIWGLVVLLNGEVARRFAMPSGSASPA